MKTRLLIPLFLLFFLFSAPTLWAQTSSQSGQPTPSVDYTLPYPGILPDNPLYVFKMVRDSVVDFFISDPIKKAEFNLLQADKRLQSGVYLAQEPTVNEALVTSTISKGENYFAEALGQLRLAKQQGMMVAPELGVLRTAAQKHEEVLTDLQKGKTKAIQQQLQHEKQRVIDFEQMVVGLSQN